MKAIHQTNHSAAPDGKTPLVSNPKEEAGWVRAVANGDRTSFRKLHERFETLIFSTVFKVLGNHEDSEDVTQEVFALIWKKAHLYDSTKGKPLTWASTMARNRAIDRYRSKQRRSLLSDRFENHVAVLQGSAVSNTEEAVRRNDASRILHDAVLELTPDQREAVELAYFKGMTQKEVAERVGLPIGTVKARIRRGIQRLEKVVTTDSESF